MTELMDLPLELLSVILTFLVTIVEGNRDLVRASATCKVFLILARRPNILRVVICRTKMLPGSCKPHHHVNSLLSRCVHAGNLTAEHILAMAVLLGRTQLWTKMKVSEFRQRTIKCAIGVSLLDRCSIAESFKTGTIADLPYILFCFEDVQHIYESHRRVPPLRHLRLFILRASFNILFMCCHRLKEFIEFFMGYDMARKSGILATINGICLYKSFIPEEILTRVAIWFRNKLVAGFDHLFLRGTEPMPG